MEENGVLCEAKFTMICPGKKIEKAKVKGNL